MKISYCHHCRKEFTDKSIEGDENFCSVDCELKSKKAIYTTMSVKHTVRNRLIVLQNVILGKVNRKIPYTDLINHILDIVYNDVGADGSVSDRIINDFNYTL
ncbi:hypothetical protein LCGC14_0225230 [marine sediment metagenome]|uniref:DUF2116 family Zn-ribbon domain-containing protein n=1 Tax=marine sediment metagenome TaxID=412755 RepID=A0A0F9UH08_9ZZZZ